MSKIDAMHKYKRVTGYIVLCFLLAGCSNIMSGVKQPSPPQGMVFVPAGWFLMGSTEKDGAIGMAVGVDELPQHKVYLKGFYIDKYEITVAEYRHFLNVTGRKAPRIWAEEEWITFYPKPIDNHPMNGVSWYDADAYCRWVDKRLPTEEEWEKAARGTDGRTWPWGNEPNSPDRARANTQEAGVGWTAPVGSFPEGVSVYGAHDMAGNVMEWTSSWYKPYPGSALKRVAFGEKYKVIRGGVWENPAIPLSRSAYRHAVAPKWDHPGHGFRCAKDM